MDRSVHSPLFMDRSVHSRTLAPLRGQDPLPFAKGGGKRGGGGKGQKVPFRF